MKKFIAILIVALFMGGSVFAQSSASGGKKSSAPTAFQLTISINPSNAEIFIDGGRIKGNVATVSAGNHTVMTRAKGYVDFSTTVSVSGTMNLPITMSPATFQLSVNANNVKGAQVLINGRAMGNTPFASQLSPGTYTITVQAPGFLGYNESFTLTGAKSIDVSLQSATFLLSVNATNVKGAQVLLNGSMAGNAPFNSQLSPGTYTVTVQAPGFVSYVESFTFTGPKSINVTLQPAMGTVSVVLPAASINTSLGGNHWNQIGIWIDGNQVKGQMIQLAPGRHLIKIASGGLQVEGFYDIQAGGMYTIEPFMGLNLKQ